MATIINADTSNGLKLTSDTSGEIELQSAGVTKAKITSSGLQNASGSAITSQAGRNLIINGNMGTSQRGTSFTGLTGISYNLDRWETTAYTMTGGQYQVDQSTDAPEGFAYSQKISCTTAHTQDVNNQFYIQQQIEGVNSSQLNYFVASPDTVTLSFWVKANLTGSYTCALKLSDNGSTENNTSTRVYNTTYSISSADTWEKKTVTIVLDSAVGDVQVVDNRFAVSVQWWLGAGTSRDGAAADSWINYGNATTAADNLDLLGSTANEWYITGVQLEANTTATPFEHLQYGQQLLLCQRYYQFITGADTSYAFFGTGTYISSGECRGFLQIPYSGLRATPTVTFGGTASNYRLLSSVTKTCTSISGIISNKNGQLYFSAVSGASTIGNSAYLSSNGTSVTYITISAEL